MSSCICSSVAKKISSCLLYFKQGGRICPGASCVLILLISHPNRLFWSWSSTKADMNFFCICLKFILFRPNFNKILKPFLHCSCFMWIVWRNLFLNGLVFNIGVMCIGVHSFHNIGTKSFRYECYGFLRVNFLMFWPVCSNHPKKETLTFRHKRILLSLFKLLRGFRKNINRIFSQRVLWVDYVCQRTFHCLFLGFCATLDCGQIE